MSMSFLGRLNNIISSLVLLISATRLSFTAVGLIGEGEGLEQLDSRMASINGFD